MKVTRALPVNCCTSSASSNSCKSASKRRWGFAGRHALFAVGNAICQALVEKLSGLPNYEQIVDLVIPAIESAIATAGREQKREPLRLTQEVVPQ